MYGARNQVKLQIADLQKGGLAARVLAAAQGFDAGDQLGEGEGLDQIVVTPGFQARDPIIDLPQSREKQDRRGIALPSQGGDRRQAVHLGHHAVDHQNVEPAAPRRLEPRFAIRRMCRLVTCIRETLNDGLGGADVVLHDQDAHACPPEA